MKEYKVPVQSLIDHIKTAVDVDPWAKEMAEELLKLHIPAESGNRQSEEYPLPTVQYDCQGILQSGLKGILLPGLRAED